MSGEEVSSRRELMAAQARLERKRQELRAARNTDAAPFSTLTRELGLSDSQVFHEIQVRQDLHESPSGDGSPSTASNDNFYANRFTSGNYGAIPDKEFVCLAWNEDED